MYQIVSSTAHKRTIHHTLPSFAEAEAFAKRQYKILDYEKDESQAYDCADFYTTSGQVYAIEPVR
jgi:hypothetical protein